METSVIMTVSDLAHRSKSVGDILFPNRTDSSMFLKLYSEIGEMIDSDGDPEEVADVFIMLLDYAARKKIDIEHHVLAKMKINLGRAWTCDVNGVFRHVGDKK